MARLPPGFTAEEWEGWAEFRKHARVLARGLGCTPDTAMLLLGLNDISKNLEDLKDAMIRRPPEEPWKGE